MPTGLLIGIIVAVVVIALVVVFLALAARKRRQRLREKFGPEYDRAVQDNSGRLAAERDLENREKRRAELDIRPLSPQSRERYANNWAQIQQQFVDQPNRAVIEADRALTALMAERGYPTEGFEQQLADLSVDHARTLENYRTAHDIMRRQQGGEPTTEDLRSAMLHYRTLFEELLDTGGRHAEEPGEAAPPTTPVPQQAPPAQQAPPPPPAGRQPGPGFPLAPPAQPGPQPGAVPPGSGQPVAGQPQPPPLADDLPTPAHGQPRQEPPPGRQPPR